MDLVMVYKDDVISNQKRLYKQYFGIIPSFCWFNKIIKGLNPCECSVCYNSTNKNTFNDKVRDYKSNYVPLNKVNKMCVTDKNENI